jgi:hypothetical protein
VALSRFENAVSKVEKSLDTFPIPPRDPRVPLTAISHIIETITTSMNGEFPDPSLPPRVAVEIWNRAVARHNQKLEQKAKDSGKPKT